VDRHARAPLVTDAAGSVLAAHDGVVPDQGAASALRHQGLARRVWGGFLARDGATMKLGLYARVSTPEPQTFALQQDAMAAYAQQRQGAWS
jgi:hypothetical protein